MTSRLKFRLLDLLYGLHQSPWYKLPKDCSLLLSPTSERRCSKMMINHGFFSRYCINLLRKWILYIKIFVCQGRCYNFKPLTCSMSPGPNCPVCPTPYSSTNAFQSLGNLYEGLCSALYIYLVLSCRRSQRTLVGTPTKNKSFFWTFCHQGPAG